MLILWYIYTSYKRIPILSESETYTLRNTQLHELITSPAAPGRRDELSFRFQPPIIAQLALNLFVGTNVLKGADASGL